LSLAASGPFAVIEQILGPVVVGLLADIGPFVVIKRMVTVVLEPVAVCHFLLLGHLL